MPFLLNVRGAAPVAAGKVVAVAKNYEDHVREMNGFLGSGAVGDQEPPEDPVVFLKPSTCLIGDGGVIVIPQGVTNVHFETELAVVVGATLRNAREDEALRSVMGYAVFLDMTARDLQAQAKRAGMPWALSKGLDTFGPISEVVPAEAASSWDKFELVCLQNGVPRQRSFTAAMTHSVPRLLSFISRHMTLEPGDVVATGTPAGVGPVAPGDTLEARLEGFATLRVSVSSA